MVWIYIITAALAAGAIVSGGMCLVVRPALLFILACGIGAIAALFVSAIVPGGLFFEWYSIAFVGALASGGSAVWVVLVLRFFGKCTFSQPEVVATLLGVVLATLGCGGLLVVAATGPGFVSAAAIAGLFIIATVSAVFAFQRPRNRNDVGQ